MKFERGIWPETAHNFWVNRWVALVVVVLIVGVSALQDLTQSTNAGTWVEFAWLPLVVAAHSTILKGTGGFGTVGATDWRSVYWPFVLRSTGLSLIGLVPAMIIAIAVVGFARETMFFIILSVIYAVVASFTFAKWGTMLPACVAQGDKSIHAAGLRGAKTFGYVFSRLWVCNGALLAGGTIGLLALYMLGSTLTEGNEGAVDRFVLDGVIPNLMVVVFAFNLVMLATILSRAYLIAEDKMNEAPAAASAS